MLLELESLGVDVVVILAVAAGVASFAHLLYLTILERVLLRRLHHGPRASRTLQHRRG
jgi:hypothetical protein